MKRLAALMLSSVLGCIVWSSPTIAQQAPEQPAEEAPRRTPDTLMFSIDELNEIQGRIASGGAEAEESRESAAIEDAALYLSTILFYSPTDWTIWVNDVPISPNQDFRSFEITNIGPDFVELLVPLSAQGMRPVRLAPNQSFVVSSGAVVEGRWTR